MHDVQPPKWSRRLLRFIVHQNYLEEIEGDLDEVFQDDLELLSVQKARSNYAWGVIQLLRPNLVRKMLWLYQLGIINIFMRTIRIAFRNLLKFKSHTTISLVGLSVSLAISGLVLKYALDQLSFDHFHEHKDRLFKVVTANGPEGGLETNAWPVGHRLLTDYPEVEAVLYTRAASSGFKVNHKGSRYDHELYFASESFFSMFSFPLIAGDPATALEAPFSIVITERMAKKYFEGDPLGQTLTLQDSLDFTITGVSKSIPKTSHIQFEALVSFSTYQKLTDFSYTEGWGNFNVRNYIRLKEGTDPAKLQAKVSGLYEMHVGEWLEEMGVAFQVELLPLTTIYLDGRYWNGFGPNTSKEEMQTLILIAVFLLLLACVNYVNLSTARSVHRAKEIGVRKVVGSSRVSIITQFMTESVLLTCLAMVLGFVLIWGILPFFNHLMSTSYRFVDFLVPEFLMAMSFLLVFVSVMSGFYPALIMSGFKPLKALAGKGLSSKRSLGLRKGLIIFQFFISSGLVIATLIVISQLKFMKAQPLGFDKEQVLILDATDVPMSSGRQVLKTELGRLSSVQRVSYTNALPGRPGWQGQWAYPGQISGEAVDTEYMAVDAEYVRTLGLELVAGNDFQQSKTSELENGLLINETCVKAMGWSSPEEALGQRIVSPSQRPQGTVIGVVKDYHGLGLQERIWPKAMDFAGHEYGRYYAIRFSSAETQQLISEIETTWDQVFSGYPLKFFFLDKDFERQYQAEDRLASMLSIFAVIIILVSVIGLLGLISFITLSKTKEVGIRKVMGVHTSHIIYILSRQFFFLVLIGNVLAIPMVWYFGQEWLQGFAYRTSLSPILFLIATTLTLVVAFTAIGLQTFRTARMNPVTSLRYE